MTKIKMCGLSRDVDIEAANDIKPEHIGFVFWKKSRRFVTDEQAEHLKSMLLPEITSVGVFLDDDIDHIVSLAKNGIIDMIQLHGHEDESYIEALRWRTNTPVIKAFIINAPIDIKKAETSTADHILLDAGTGSGDSLDWSIIGHVKRHYYLAGGLTPKNVAAAIEKLHPYAVDVSSGIETDGLKDPKKMRLFKEAVLKSST